MTTQKKLIILFLTLFLAILLLMLIAQTSKPEPLAPIQAITIEATPGSLSVATFTPASPVITDNPTQVPTANIEPVNTPISFVSPDPGPANHDKTRHLIALRAVELAVKSMPGSYSWEEYRSCSTLASAYLRQLSFPVADLHGNYADHPDPLPFSSVVAQVDWFRRNYPQHTHDQSLDNFLTGRLWSEIPIGSLVYLQTAVGHNGYNTYYHVVILVDYQGDRPIFAEIAGGMSNASTSRSFEQVTKYYKRFANGTWDTAPYNTGAATINPLVITWVDPLAILNAGALWRQDTPVRPNGQILKQHFDQVVTININNGLLIIYRKDGSNWQMVSIAGKTHFYTVVGRRLPANNTITKNFYDRRPDIYDGDFGVYISQQGIYQDTWTPPLMFELTGFERLANFGGIGGSTDTSILKPLIYNTRGQFELYHLNSSFTLHLIPDVTNQDILLRVDLITQANRDGHPVPKPTVYLSSGCVNIDQANWQILKDYLQSELDRGQKIAVVFSYPHMDQDLLPHNNLSTSPFTATGFEKWCPEENFFKPCDYIDRRDYRDTYLD
jgi:hypothetical protein